MESSATVTLCCATRPILICLNPNLTLTFGWENETKEINYSSLCHGVIWFLLFPQSMVPILGGKSEF